MLVADVAEVTVTLRALYCVGGVFLYAHALATRGWTKDSKL